MTVTRNILAGIRDYTYARTQDAESNEEADSYSHLNGAVSSLIALQDYGLWGPAGDSVAEGYIVALLDTARLYDLCASVYSAGGQSDVYDFVVLPVIRNAYPDIKWGWCEPCDCGTPLDPDDGVTCLTCGSECDTSREIFVRDSCAACGSHLSEPHAPDCVWHS